MRRRSTPEYILETIRTELADKGSVVLVPEQGEPRWQQSVFDFRIMTGISDEGHWRIDCPEPVGYVELLRDIPLESYRLRAEIWHVRSNPTGDRVGVFFGHQSYLTATATPHYWAALTFNDVVLSEPPKKNARGNPVHLWFEVYSNNGVDKPGSKSWSDRAITTPAAQKWRMLEVERVPRAD